MPVGEESWLVLTNGIQPLPRPDWFAPQSFELLHGPSKEVLVDAQCQVVQLGAIEEGGGEELPLPAPVKPDVSLSTHPAYHLGCSTKGSSLLPDWPSGPPRSGAFAPGPLQPLHHYYAPVRPSAPHPVLSPSVFDLGVLPFPPFLVGPRHDWFPSSIQEPAPRSCPLYAGHRLAKSEMTPPGLERAVKLTRFQRTGWLRLWYGTAWVDESVVAMLTETRPHLDERQWRLLLGAQARALRSEEHTSELQSLTNLVC